MRISDWSSDVCSSDLGTHDWVQAALDHDGSVIAIERALERADDGVVVRSDARTTSLDDGAYEEHDVAAGRFMPIWVEGESLASAPAPGEHLRDANVEDRKSTRLNSSH